MTVKTGGAWAGTFVTLDATGALATPGTGPAGVLYVDGTANAAEVTITGSNPYKFAVTLPALTAGQRVDMYITATIATIATAAVVASEQADTVHVSDVKTDTAAILLDTGTDGVLLSAGTGAKQISLSSGAVLLQPTQTGVTIPTVTTVTNAPTGMALEATLTAIKGAGWSNETLKAIKTDTAATLLDTGTTGVPLTAAAIDAILDEAVEGSYTLRQLLRIVSSTLAGKVSGGGTATITFRDVNDSTDRVIATVDASGNRTAITLDVT